MSAFSLEDYGVVGNFSSSMLINRVGSVDWACLPYLDSPSHFGAILDDVRGGKFQISPQGDFRSEQRYHQRTLVLETLFETPLGRGVITDWMPLEPDSANEPLLYRQIDMIEGKITWMINCAPRFDYAQSQTEVEFHGAREGEARSTGATQAWSPRRALFRGCLTGQIAQLFCSVALDYSIQRNSAETKLSLSAGESALFAWSWGRKIEAPAFHSFKETAEAWRKLAHHCGTPGGTLNATSGSSTGCAFAGPWHDAITRSGLFLKLLIAPYSGSIAEAITTSVPGIVPGIEQNGSATLPSRNWDYRYSWIRHGAMAMQALHALGYRDEARNYFSWLSEIVIRDGVEGLQPVYTLDGGKLLNEKELPHLKGFHNAKPVRVGNETAVQFHLDIYGHIFLAAEYYYNEWASLPQNLWPALVNIADHVCQAWRRPDFGPWELRGKPEHYVASKILSWAALDRAISLAKRLKEPVSPRWIEEAKTLHKTICEQGFDSDSQTFVRTFGDRDIDASTLWIFLTGFLPLDDSRVQGTLDAVLAELCEGVLTRRYRTQDGLSGRDGAYVSSSFMVVTALSLSGRINEASDRLAELCTYCTHLGFFGEQIDPALQETSGNFPSATSHLALINAALYVGAARGREIPSLFMGNQKTITDQLRTLKKRTA